MKKLKIVVENYGDGCTTQRHQRCIAIIEKRSKEQVCEMDSTLSPGVIMEYGALFAAAPETAAECDRLREVNAAYESCLIAAAKIIGKVVADDLMPGISKPNFPAMTLENIRAALALGKEKP